MKNVNIFLAGVVAVAATQVVAVPGDARRDEAEAEAKAVLDKLTPDEKVQMRRAFRMTPSGASSSTVPSAKTSPKNPPRGSFSRSSFPGRSSGWSWPLPPAGFLSGCLPGCRSCPPGVYRENTWHGPRLRSCTGEYCVS